MLLHKDESARDTTLFRRFLTKTTSIAKNLAHALTGAPDFPFGSNSKIASYSPLYRLTPTDDSLKVMKNTTYSYQSFSYIDILSKKIRFVNRFSKKIRKTHRFMKFGIANLNILTINFSIN